MSKERAKLIFNISEAVIAISVIAVLVLVIYVKDFGKEEAEKKDVTVISEEIEEEDTKVERNEELEDQSVVDSEENAAVTDEKNEPKSETELTYEKGFNEAFVYRQAGNPAKEQDQVMTDYEVGWHQGQVYFELEESVKAQVSDDVYNIYYQKAEEILTSPNEDAFDQYLYYLLDFASEYDVKL